MTGMNRVYLIGIIENVSGFIDEHRPMKAEIMTPYSHKTDSGWEKSYEKHTLQFFGEEAKFLARHAKKGDHIAIEGTIRTPNDTPSIHITHILWLSTPQNNQ